MESRCFDSEINTNPGQSNLTELRSQFPDYLSHIYWIENTLLKTLPDWNKVIHSNSLNKALSEYHLTVAEQVYQLEHIFELMKLKAQAKICKEMTNFLKSDINLHDNFSSEINSDLYFISKLIDIVSVKMHFYQGVVDTAKALKLQSVYEWLLQNLANETHAGHTFLNFKRSN